MFHSLPFPAFLRAAALCLAGWFLCPALPAHAVGVQNIYTFGIDQPFYPGLTVGRDGNLYTVTTSEENALLRITPDGTATKLHAGPSGAGFFAGPLLLAKDGCFYGVMPDDGSNGTWGGLYRSTPDGTLTVLHVFTGGGADGGNPQPGLAQGADGALYGVTDAVPDNPNGTIFRCALDGTLTTLHRFTGGADGALPQGLLTPGRDGNLYGGTTSVLFRVNTAGTFTTLHTFPTRSSYGSLNPGFVQDAAGFFYGTTNQGGGTDDDYSGGFGTVFRFGADGIVTTLFRFDWSSAVYPVGPLAVGPDGNFYGIAADGGDPLTFNVEEGGALFRVTPAGAVSVVYHEHSDTGLHFALAGLVTAPNGDLYAQTFDGVLRVRLVTAGLLGLESDTFHARADDGAAFVTVGRIDDSRGAVSVDYTTADDTARAGTDYTAVSGTLHWADGDASVKTVRVPLAALPSASNDAQFSFRLTNPGGGAALGVQAEGTVNIDAPTGEGPGVALVPFYVFSGNADGNTIRRLFVGADGSLFGSTVGSGPNGDRNTLFRLAPDAGLTAPADAAFLETDGLTRGPDGNFYGTRVLPGSPDLCLCRLTPAGVLTSQFDLGLPTANGDAYRTLVAARDGGFYGAVQDGSSNTPATVRIFRIGADGRQTTLHTLDGNAPVYLTEGADGTLYGIRYAGGANNNGFIFRVSPTGDGYQTVHDFAVNSPHADVPGTPLMLAADGNLYGLTLPDGNEGQATFYRIKTRNGHFKVMHTFDFKKEGSPADDLLLGADGNLYGTLGYASNEFSYEYERGGDTLFRVTPKGEVTLLYYAGRNRQFVRLLGRSPDGVLYLSDTNPGTHLYRLELNATGTPTVALDLLSGDDLQAGFKGRALVTRDGSLNAPLAVPYQISGTARAGTDYQPLSGTAIVGAGQVGARIVVKPLPSEPGVPTNTSTLDLQLERAGDGDYRLAPGNTKVEFEIIRGVR